MCVSDFIVPTVPVVKRLCLGPGNVIDGLQFPGPLPCLLGPAPSPAQMDWLVWTGRGTVWTRAACQACTMGDHTEHHQPLPLEKQTRVSWDWDSEEKEHFP